MSKHHFYATERAFEWLDSSTVSTMFDLYRITHTKKSSWYGYGYMTHLEVVGHFPTYVFKLQGETVGLGDHVHYVGYFDDEQNKGHNESDILTMMEVMYGTLQRCW